MKNLLTAAFILSAIGVFHYDARADKVYQWTDAEGVVHFSDAPPADTATTGTREIHFDNWDSGNADRERYSIIEQADIMAGWRRQISEERLALKRLYLEDRRLAQEQELQRLETMTRLQEQDDHRPYYYVFPLRGFRDWHNHYEPEQPEPSPPPNPRAWGHRPDHPHPGEAKHPRIGVGS
jgi:hypothetical protein